MNKKIYKGYELAEAVDNGILNLEQKVKTVNNMEYYNCTIDFILKDIAKNIMFKEFEILEDNTEEIEELKYFTSLNSPTINENELEIRIEALLEKINEIVKSANQIRKENKK